MSKWLSSIAFVLTIVVSGAPSLVLAQTEEAVDERRQALQRELNKVESEIQEQQVVLDKKSAERASLERDVGILNASIQKSKLGIKARDLTIQNLSGEIGGKEKAIGSLNDKLGRQKESLGQIIRRANEIDDYSLVEVALSNQDISDFFEDVDSFASIQTALRASFDEIAGTKVETQKQKESLEDRRAQEVELKGLQELEKKKIEVQEAERRQVLNVTKGEEAVYQSILQQKQQTAAQIRAELFSLRGSAAIPFGKALEYANLASKQTGVRPALILGTLQQETKLGEFLGNGNWRTDMHPTRDQPVFLKLMQELGLDPDSVPVSAAPGYGWGGAMGPAQFIPSTWVLYQDRIGSLTGHKPPNPYDPGDAFMAAALLLADNGAIAGNRASERLAALRYFAGWGNANKPAYAFYGDEVISFADKYQAQINILSNG